MEMILTVNVAQMSGRLHTHIYSSEQLFHLLIPALRVFCG